MKHLIALVLLLALLCGCGAAPAGEAGAAVSKEGQDFTTTLTLPDSVPPASASMLELPDRLQTSWYSEDGTVRLVLETMADNPDVIHAAQSETVPVGDGEGTLYAYAGEEIEYPTLSEGAIHEMNRPEDGDLILEWEVDGVFCRLFGNVSREMLLTAAGTLEVHPL